MRLLRTEVQDERFAGYYELNDTYADTGCHIGLLLTYLCASRFSKILTSVGMRDADMNMRTFSREEFFRDFPTFNAFNDEFSDGKFTHLATEVQLSDGVAPSPFPLYISGELDSNKLTVYYPKEKKVTVNTALEKVERETYAYHSFPREAVSRMIRLFGIDEKNAVLSLKKLSRHQDIYDEFISGLRDDRYVYRSDDPVVVRGHTAEQLKSSYHVNVLGSYDLLIFLRENPKDEPFSLNSLQA